MLGIESGRAGRAGDAVLVTDGSTAIGSATALALAEQGFRVFAGVRSLAPLGDVLEQVEVLRLDPADPVTVDEAVRAVVDDAGGIFGLVTGGGPALRGALEDSSEEEIRQVFEANVLGAVALTKAVLPHMRAARCGRLVTISPTWLPGYGVSTERAAQCAQEGLAEGLALELAPFGIQSILVAPGCVQAPERDPETAEAAHRFESPYYGPFWASEAIADRIVETSITTAAAVTSAVAAALTAEQPRLRYVVGPRASAVSLLRRHLPERLFGRLYYGAQLRRLERLVDPALLPEAASR